MPSLFQQYLELNTNLLKRLEKNALFKRNEHENKQEKKYTHEEICIIKSIAMLNVLNEMLKSIPQTN